VFCSQCGSRFDSEIAKFCSACGEQRHSIEPTSPTTSSPDSIQVRTDALIRMLKRGNLTSEEISDLIDAHIGCFDGDFCEVCEHLDETADSSIIIMDLLEHPNSTPDLQSKLLDAAASWQGRLEGAYLCLASNPNISDENRDYIIDPVNVNDWWNGDDIEETLQILVEHFEHNNRFSFDSIDAFVETINLEYNISIDYSMTSDSNSLLFFLPLQGVVEDENAYRASQVADVLRIIASNPDGYLFPRPHVLRKERLQSLLENFWLPKKSKTETCPACAHINQASIAVCWNCCAELKSGESGELFAIVSMTRPKSEFEFDELEMGDAESLAQMVDINYVSAKFMPAVFGESHPSGPAGTNPNARAKELHLLAQEDELDAEAVKLLVAQHFFCFGSNSCEICESLSKLKLQGIQSIFEWVIALESTVEPIVSLMLLFANRVGALETALLLAAENPSIGENLKNYFLDVENLPHWAPRGIEAAFEELYATFEENSAFTKTELKKFNQDYEAL
jgi:hypothetical protein